MRRAAIGVLHRGAGARVRRARAIGGFARKSRRARRRASGSARAAPRGAHLLVEHDAQQPWRNGLHIDVIRFNVVKVAHEIRVFGDDGHDVVLDHHAVAVEGQRVVPDLRRLGERAQRRVLEQCLDTLGLVRIATNRLAQIHSERWRLRPLRDVDDLLEARHAKRHVLGRDAGVVERVERHLRRGLADRLRGERAAHLARVRKVHFEFGLDLADHPVEGLLGEAVVLEQHL